MTAVPKWYLPVAVLALFWNLIGCAAYLSDVTLTPEAIAAMTPAQQAMYASRPSWAVAATATAVWGGALGCLGLILRRRWALPLLMASAWAVVVQDLAIFVLTDAGRQAGAAAYVLQALVLVIAVALVRMARKASTSGWLR